MKIIAIDPGETTGCCVWTDTDKDQYTIRQFESYSIGQSIIDAIIRADLETIVVIEKPPIRGNDVKLVGLYGQILSHANKYIPSSRLFTPLPGQWKPWVKQFAKAKMNEIPPKFRHARDARGMGLYILSTR